MTESTTTRQAKSSPITDLAKAGSWSALQHIGSKAQVLALMAAGAITTGTSGVGLVTSVFGAAVFASSMTDFGYGSECARVLAGSPSRQTSFLVMRGGVVRATAALILGVLLGLASFWRNTEAMSIIVVPLVAVALFGQSLATSLMYGLSHFRATSTVAARWRVAGAACLPVVAFIDGRAGSLLVAMALVELVVACTLLMALRTAIMRLEPASPTPVTIQPSYALGIGTVVNTLVNRSDTFLLSLLAGPTLVGMYAIASQVENAVTTLALVPSTALPTFVAHSTARKSEYMNYVYRITQITFIAALSLASLTAAGVWGLHAVGSRILGHGVLSADQAWVILVCLIGAPFCAAAGSMISAYVGVGDHKRIGIAWTLVAASSVPSTIVLVQLHSVLGPSLSALGRDLILFGLSIWLWLRRPARKYQSAVLILSESAVLERPEVRK